MTFVAQFGFGDSRDIVGRLPGDVLLVFAPDEFALMEPERLMLLWSKASRRLIAAEDSPVPGWRLGPVFGVRHRTCDVSGAFPFMSGVEHALRKLMPECRFASTWRIPVMQATKIGGLPYDAQTNEPTPPPGHRFLCQLSSVGPGRRSWSRVNRRRPRRGGSDDCLMIGDAGSISFWIDRKGRVRADASSS